MERVAGCKVGGTQNGKGCRLNGRWYAMEEGRKDYMEGCNATWEVKRYRGTVEGYVGNGMRQCRNEMLQGMEGGGRALGYFGRITLLGTCSF